MRRKADITKVCAYCGQEFLAHNKTKKYCSNSCRVLAYQERVREKYGYIPKNLAELKKTQQIQEAMGYYLTPKGIATAVGIGVLDKLTGGMILPQEKSNPFKKKR